MNIGAAKTFRIGKSDRIGHRRADDPATVNMVGEVLVCEPPKKLVLSWAAPADKNDRARHTRVAIELQTRGFRGAPHGHARRIPTCAGNAGADQRRLAASPVKPQIAARNGGASRCRLGAKAKSSLPVDDARRSSVISQIRLPVREERAMFPMQPSTLIRSHDVRASQGERRRDDTAAAGADDSGGLLRSAGRLGAAPADRGGPPLAPGFWPPGGQIPQDMFF